MKRFLTTLVTVLLLSMALTVAASASDFDAAAKDLSAIGMFRGTEAGFELDRAPTRSEAAIMLVRLYGAEEKAAADYKAGTISHPFTDVSDFTAPYVAWLYTNGLTNGTSATTFGSASQCSLQQYVVFLLRALGYEDGKDFAYADALTFAQQKGFYDSVTFAGDFLRDDLAAVTYQALAADVKDGITYLLASLVKSGAVDAEAAKPMTEKFEAYRALSAASAGMDQTAMDADVDMKVNMTMTMAGEKTNVAMTGTGNVKVIMDDKDLQMAYDMKTTVGEDSMDMGMWLKDGVMYQSTTMDGETTSVKYPLNLEEQLAVLENTASTQTAANVSGLAMIDSITAKTSGSSTVYTVSMGSGMNAALQGVMGLMNDESGMDLSSLDFQLGEVTAVYTVSGSGKLTKVQMEFSAAMDMDLGDGVTMAAAYDYDIGMKINATGKDVKITYPDFSGFQEVEIPAIEESAA